MAFYFEDGRVRKAYWNEPHIRSYPGQWVSILGLILILWGMECFGISINVLRGASPMPQIIGFRLDIAIWIACIVFIVTGTLWIQLGHDIMWARSFRANNADLGINYRAVHQSLVHMRETTTYACLDFQCCVTMIAICLRCPEDAHTTFSAELLATYSHFATGESELPVSQRPKPH